MIVGRADSRVPPELVFDQRLGRVFVARMAGNFVDTDIIGSLEFATRLAGARLGMVLDRSERGAVKGAIDNVQLGNLTAALSSIRPAVEAATGIAGKRSSKSRASVRAVAETNAGLVARMPLERSPTMAGRVRCRVAQGGRGDARHRHGAGWVRLLG